MTPLFRDGDQVEYYDEDADGAPVWRPGTIVGTRYDIRPTGGGLHTVHVDAIRSAPRLPLEGIEQ